jgi:hypothetical protein
MALTVQSRLMPKGAANSLALSLVRRKVLIMDVESAGQLRRRNFDFRSWSRSSILGRSSLCLGQLLLELSDLAP